MEGEPRPKISLTAGAFLKDRHDVLSLSDRVSEETVQSDDPQGGGAMNNKYKMAAGLRLYTHNTALDSLNAAMETSGADSRSLSLGWEDEGRKQEGIESK